MTLAEFFQEHPRAALGFSGGTDSACLLWAGVRYGEDIRPYYVKSPFQPAFELEDARRLCRELGVALHIVEADTLALPRVAENGPGRCYHCKKAMFSLLKARAQADGFPLLLDGSNASDDPAARPGMAALAEEGVVSPLRLCGLTKDAVRRLSREAGLFTWDKPAYACLATRVPTGEAITAEKLSRVEGAEAALTAMGFSDLRVRVFGGAARLQLPGADIPAAARALEIQDALAPYFDTVLLDMKGR